MMKSKFSIRSWWGATLCGLLGFAISVSADTRTQNQKPPKHSASSHASAAHSKTKHSSAKSTHNRKSKAKAKSAKKRGQQVIDSERARQIQEALIREHYLDGVPSGTWDAATQAAMQRYQADQGWQSKTTPDARALIKLGLGPSPEHLLNPESAMTSAQTSTASADPPAKANSKANSADPPALPASKTPAGDAPQQ